MDTPLPPLADSEPLRTQVVCAVGLLATFSLVGMALAVAMPGAPYLKYEPSDVAALIGAFTMGPGAGLLVVGLRNLLRLMLFDPDVVGLSLNLVASGSFVLVAGLLYRRVTTRRGAILALAAATAVQALVMTAVNATVLPLYLGVPLLKLLPTLLTVVLPFNILKGALNSLLVYLLYKRISGYFPRLRTPAEV